MNYAKANVLNLRLFSLLCDKMESDDKQLLLHAEVLCLLKGKVRNVLIQSKFLVLLQSKKPTFRRSQPFKNMVWATKLFICVTFLAF